MSIRNLFDGDIPYSIFSEKPDDVRKDAESLGNVESTFKNRNRFIPQIDFGDPSNFARYGSAEKYYQDAIVRIYEDYPYDGSSKEKEEFLYNSTYVDLWLLENKYPRTNGYINHGETNDYTAPVAGATILWPTTDTDEYINVKGGPHTASQGMIGKSLPKTFDDSNIYDEDIYDDVGYTGKGTRESNLKCDPDSGVTVEFWLKKPSWSGPPPAALPLGETIFDLSGTNDGRFNITITTGSAATTALNCLYRAQTLSSSYTPDVSALISTGSWNHIAVSYANSGSVAKWKLYLNGTLADAMTTANQPVEITGSLQANIGALVAQYPGDTGTSLGVGKLTGSLDEFRFWKTQRTSEEIGRNWFTQVYGGTNTDISNTSLGVYYKFNEGIVGNTSSDSVVLDYSGRITNGQWTGYTSNSRNTGSAMVLSNAAVSEFKDPIIYPSNPLVKSVSTEMSSTGSVYDRTNGVQIYNTMPSWIIDDDEQEGGTLKNLTQIMSSYFDTLHLQIEQLPKLKDITYVSSSNEELVFANELLEGSGFVAPEIFIDAEVINQVFSRNEKENYTQTLSETKNLIYKNIYNNLLYIYKSKGTEKSFRNLIRCFGVDDELIKINLYANNLSYELENKYRFTTIKKRFVDFYNSSNFSATVYQQTSSGDLNSTTFISASSGDLEKYTGFTLETDIIFPKKREISQQDYFSTPFNTSSIFGFHSADPSLPADLTWASTDYDLSLYAIRNGTEDSDKDAHFLLTSSYFGINMETDIFPGVYENKKWHFSIRFGPTKGHSNLVSGSSDTEYTLQFQGLNSEIDIKREEFSLSSSISNSSFLTIPKRIYLGAHRTNFTGSAIYNSDIRASYVRYWMKELTDEALQNHSYDIENYGTSEPQQNSYNFVTSLTGNEIPNIETLAMNWSWDQVDSSDASGKYEVKDLSSGSNETTNRYSWIGSVTNKKHGAYGDYFSPNSTKVINVEYVPSAVLMDPESLNPRYDLVKILSQAEQEEFTRTDRPVDFFYSIEKSMYQTISENMIKTFGAIVDFGNAFGEPVDRFRHNYKNLDHLRALFYENVENEPDIERFIEYYKWVDSSLSQMIEQLIPASSNFSDGIKTVIESHIFERNKYRHKFLDIGKATILTATESMAAEDEESATATAGVSSWKNDSPPIPFSENENCYWWKNRADRTTPEISSGNPQVDEDRNQILSVLKSRNARKSTASPILDLPTFTTYKMGLNSRNNNMTNYVKNAISFGDSRGLVFLESEVKDFIDCTDVIDPLEKKKMSYESVNELYSGSYSLISGDMSAPFVAVSSSVITGYNSQINSNFKDGFGITNMHIDSYEAGEIPLQGPFTRNFVGGSQHRHISLNTGIDNALNRPEAWNMQFSTSPAAIKIVYQPINSPRATLYRDLVAKRYINISYIKNNSDENVVGNYSKDYQVIQTTGRSVNNIAFVHSGGFDVEEIPSPYVSGLSGYAKPQRGRTEFVFVNRFSSPGSPDTAGDSNGGPALDPESAEYSPYNNLNYRNTSVRDINRLLLSSHVNEFGYYSDTFSIGDGGSEVNSSNYDGTGSVYQTNRNPISQLRESGSSIITASVYDNYWVQHAIPQTDLQYMWITSSYSSYDSYGYLPYSGEESSSSGQISLVSFSSASDFVSSVPASLLTFGRDVATTSWSVYHTPYNWMNTNVYEPSEYLSANIGYEQQSVSAMNVGEYLNDDLIYSGLNDLGRVSLLNAILLKRNGPYQNPSWKQTRGSENPIVRKWKSTAHTAYNKKSIKYIDPLQNEYSPRNGSLEVLKDPPIIGKYMPLGHGIKVVNYKKGRTFSVDYVKLRSTYGNALTFFANKQVSKDNHLIESPDLLPYRGILEMYSEGALQDSNNSAREFGYLSYSEQVYPSSINCYINRNRERVGFENTFWNLNRTRRNEIGQLKNGGNTSQGFNLSQSAWSLDTSVPFGTDLGLSSYVAHNYSASGAAGELQNDYTFYWAKTTTDTERSSSFLRPSPILSRKQGMNSFYSTVTPTGMEFLVNARTSSVYLSVTESVVSIFTPYGSVMARGGNAKFEAHELSGYVLDGEFISASATPFYDKYEQFNLNMRLKNKDMSLIPEFKISDHIEKYLNDTGGFLSENTSSFSITGISSSNTQNISYLNALGAQETYSIQTGDDIPQNSSEDNFYQIYSFSDFMNYFDVFEEDHKQFDLPKTLTLSCKALMKFIPYDGFYPSERALNIASAFSQSYASYITCSGSPYSGSLSDPLRNRPVYETLFSPGVLFNTIKSGIAVDYPIHTSSYDLVAFKEEATSATTTLYAIGTSSNGGSGWDHRVSFETLLNPENLNEIPMVDMNVSPLSRLNITSSLSAPSTNNSYKMMINNYLAEIPNFFLDGLTKVESNDAKDFVLETGQTYGMRVKLYRSMNKERISAEGYPVPQDNFNQTGLHETITMYSRPTAFGPPVAGSNTVISSSLQCDSNWGINPSFTPPYYNGEAWADVIYYNEQTGSVTLDDIFATASVKYLRSDGTSLAWPMSPPSGAAIWPMTSSIIANRFSMQLSASINLFRKSEENKWTIQTKFETPILNFGDKTKRPLTYDNISLPSTGTIGSLSELSEGYGGVTTTPIGMWHQFGLVPEENQGIYFSIGDIDSEWLKHRATSEDNNTLYNSGNIQSLASAVGFNTTPQKLGKLKESKTVYEAIVAVPFIERPDKTKYKVGKESLKIGNNKRLFFKMPARSKDAAELKEKMNKFVFPPEFDVLRNKKAKNISMYVFEFDHTFDRDDLSYMWQNISPKFGTEFKEASSTIAHPLIKGQLLTDLKDEVRWMVFKVKQRAKTNYYDNVVGAPNINNSKFGYNWPYDNFSMIEFAKMNATVDFGKSPLEDQPTEATASVPPVPESPSKDIATTNSNTTSQNKDINIDFKAKDLLKG